MARGLTSGMLTEIGQKVVRPAYFVEIETASATQRLWTGLGSRTWNSQTWLGVGDFGSISAIPETSGVNAVGLILTLSGIPSGMVTLALTDSRPFKPVKVYFGLLDSSDVIVVDPYLSFSGRTDSVKLIEGAKESDTSSLRISCESRLIELNRTRERRYTEEDQVSEFPNDKGFEFVEEIEGARMPWGEPGPSQFAATSGGSTRIERDDDDDDDDDDD